MLDPNKYETLAAVAKAAGEAEKAAFKTMDEARKQWRDANEHLANSMKTLDSYVRQCISEDTNGAKAKDNPGMA